MVNPRISAVWQRVVSSKGFRSVQVYRRDSAIYICIFQICWLFVIVDVLQRSVAKKS